MRRCQQANQRPFRCAVIPFMGNSTASGFIDTGMFLGDEKVYVSFEGAVLLAKEIGWVGPSTLREKDAEIAALRAENEQLKAEVKEADKFAEAAEYTLGRFGSKVRQKPGPKKEASNA